MAKAVFTTKVHPTYDDLPEERYHFPHTYLRVANEAVGNWIVYYEPRQASVDYRAGVDVSPTSRPRVSNALQPTLVGKATTTPT